MILVYEWGGVQEHDSERGTVISKHLAVIACGHLPATANLGIVEHSLGVAPVFMIAQNGIPGNLQFGMRIHELVVGHPQGVCYTLHSHEMMYISQCQYSFEIILFGHASHQFGDRLLFVVAIASHVVGNQKLYLGKGCCEPYPQQVEDDGKSFHTQ